MLVIPALWRLWRLERQKQVDSWSLLASQPNRSASSKPIRDPVSKYKVNSVLEVVFWSLHVHTLQVCLHTHHTHKHKLSIKSGTGQVTVPTG